MSVVTQNERSIRGEAELLAAARAGRPGKIDDFRMRVLAATAMQAPPFEELLSINAVRGFSPMEHQIGAVRQVLAKMRGRALLCDEVGMGKTIEAGLATLELVLRGLARRILILAPTSLVGQWKEELASKFALEFAAPDDADFPGWDSAPRIIASLHTAKREPHATKIAAHPFDLVVVDEAHHLRNPKTLAHRFVHRLESRYLLLLTATPVQNGLEDLFSLVSLARPGQLSTQKDFKRDHVRKDEPLLPKDAVALRRALRDVMIRNRRATSGVRFTRRYATTIKVEISEAERALYDDASAIVRRMYTEGGGSKKVLLRTVQAELGSTPAAAAGTLAKLGAEAARVAERCAKSPRPAKIDRLIRLVREFDDKMIVFTGFQASHAEITQGLREAGISVATLRGGMKFKEKEAAVAEFRDSARILLSTDVGSEGRNLQFASAVVNFDLPWNPMRIEQRIGRVSRIGQDREVYVFNLAAAGTLEDRLLELLHAKINMFEMVIGEIDSIIGHLDEERSLEEVLMEMWTRGPEEFSKSLDELGSSLLSAKQRYIAMRDTEDAVFSDALASGENGAA